MKNMMTRSAWMIFRAAVAGLGLAGLAALSGCHPDGGYSRGYRTEVEVYREPTYRPVPPPVTRDPYPPDNYRPLPESSRPPVEAYRPPADNYRPADTYNDRPLPAEEPVIDDTPYERAPVEAIRTYEADLTPYGGWADDQEYGRVWIPRGRPAGWRPYSVGRWEYTNDGMLWVSEGDEVAWGVVTYHYGRWHSHPRHGWIWVPGTTWAPAWVSWREGGGYSGWAPLPPRVYYRNRIDAVYVDRYVPSDRYVFVEDRYLCEPRVRDRFVRSDVTIINRTTNITNITVVNNRVVNYGVDRTHYERASGRRVQIAEVRQVNDWREAQTLREQGRTVAYTPQSVAKVDSDYRERVQRRAEEQEVAYKSRVARRATEQADYRDRVERRANESEAEYKARVARRATEQADYRDRVERRANESEAEYKARVARRTQDQAAEQAAERERVARRAQEATAAQKAADQKAAAEAAAKRNRVENRVDDANAAKMAEHERAVRRAQEEQAAERDRVARRASEQKAADQKAAAERAAQLDRANRRAADDAASSKAKAAAEQQAEQERKARRAKEAQDAQLRAAQDQKAAQQAEAERAARASRRAPDETPAAGKGGGKAAAAEQAAEAERAARMARRAKEAEDAEKAKAAEAGRKPR